MHAYSFRLLVGLGIALSFGLTSTPATAEVTLDGTMGQAGTLSGPNYAITADLGQQLGGNLFHSFGEFNITQGESATFSGPFTVTNIIARVTGGHPSAIDGTLRSEIAGADLYLLNPAGVIFGPHATLDLQGSFHLSTADYLNLGETGRFATLQAGNSELSADPPADFGFLGNSMAGIRFTGSIPAMPAGETISITSESGGVAFSMGMDHPAMTAIHETDSAEEPSVVPSPVKLSIDGNVRIRGSYDKTPFMDAYPSATIGYDTRVQLGFTDPVTTLQDRYVRLEAGTVSTGNSTLFGPNQPVINVVAINPVGIITAGITLNSTNGFLTPPRPTPPSQPVAFAPLPRQSSGVSAAPPTAFGF